MVIETLELNGMEELFERISNERRRRREVGNLFTTALEHGAQGDDAYVPFYMAAANYIDVSTKRLLTQDFRMLDMLREKVAKDDPTAQQALKEVEERLAGIEDRLKRLQAARDVLKKGGTAALGQFEAAVMVYTDPGVKNMGHHAPSGDLAQKLFSQKDWEFMAHIEEGDMEREQQFHSEVFAAAPPGLRQKAAN